MVVMLEDGHVREVYILCFVVLLLFCFVFLYCQAQTPAELSYISTSAPPPPPGKVFKAQVKPKVHPQLAKLNLIASLG